MSDTETPDRRIYIRKDAYYGGNLWVAVNENEGWRSDVDITWEAWGGYGRTTLCLYLDEAKKLSAALEALARKIDGDET